LAIQSGPLVDWRWCSIY